MKKLAIVILNYNGRKFLEDFLPSVVAHSKESEIYVIDNASTDDSLEFLQSQYPEIHRILNKENRGFAGGYNLGLQEIQAEYYCLLNSDVEVTSGWTQAPVELLESDPTIAAVQPKILSYHNKEYFEFAGAAGGMIDHLGYPYCRGRVFESIEKDLGQYNDETEIFWASGCALFIRGSDFWSENGFDERFFAHQEEIDLCWRLKNRGKKIYYTYRSVVYHVGGGTLNKQSPQKTYLNFRNNLSMLLKNLPSPLLFPLLFVRLSLDGIAGIRFAFTDGLGHLWAVVRSHIGFYKQAPTTWKRRGPYQMKKYYQDRWLIFKHFLSK